MKRKLSGSVVNYQGISQPPQPNFSRFYDELMYINMSVLRRYTVRFGELIKWFNPVFVSVNKVTVLMTAFGKKVLISRSGIPRYGASRGNRGALRFPRWGCARPAAPLPRGAGKRCATASASHSCKEGPRKKIPASPRSDNSCASVSTRTSFDYFCRQKWRRSSPPNSLHSWC